MNILYICDTDPRKSGFGNAQRTHFLYNALANLGMVYTLSSAIDRGIASESIRPLPKFMKRSGLFRLINAVGVRIFKALCPQGPLDFSPCRLKLNIAEEFPDVKFDIVVMRYMRRAGIVHPWRIAPTFIDIDDYPLQLFDTVYGQGSGRFRRAVSRLALKAVCWWITWHLHGAWVANPLQVKDVVPSRNVRCLRNQPPPFEGPYDPNAKRSPILMTVGLMSYSPNYMGVDDFICHIWPKIKAVHAELEYWIVGRNAPREIADRWNSVDGVRYCGFVEAIGSVYEKSLAAVVPIVQGGGTCIKTLEALSRSRVCLSTPFGVRGIPVGDIADGVNGMFVYENADEFVTALGRIMGDIAFRTEKETAARRYIEAKYSFNEFSASVLELIERGMNGV